LEIKLSYNSLTSSLSPQGRGEGEGCFDNLEIRKFLPAGRQGNLFGI
jgi:hypothetical protein